MLKKVTRLFVLNLCVLLSACGGGSSSSSETRANDFNWAQLRANAVGASSTSSISGLTVQDISACNTSSSGQAHVIPVCVDDGIGTQYRIVNRPVITVRLCVPGKYSEADCVNVDHVLVDTGSAGLRIATPALVKPLALPAVTDRSNNPVAECMRFVSGWTWGSLNHADVYVGGLVARNVSLQMMGYSSRNPQLGGNGGGAFPNVPSECSTSIKANNIAAGATSDPDITDVMQEGIQGIIGLSASAYNQLYGDQYFICPAGICSNASNFDPLLRPGHLSVYMSDYPGGVVLSFPSTGSNGARNMVGTLRFGISSLPPAASRIRLNSIGQFTTILNGQSYTQSYIDSGSNGFFFDASTAMDLPACTTQKGFYCPATSRTFTATMRDRLNSDSTVSFTVANTDALASLLTLPNGFNNLAGPVSTSTVSTLDPTFAWGFPFFLGRTVYTAMEGTSVGGTYGTVAYTSP